MYSVLSYEFIKSNYRGAYKLFFFFLHMHKSLWKHTLDHCQEDKLNGGIGK